MQASMTGNANVSLVFFSFVFDLSGDPLSGAAEQADPELPTHLQDALTF